MIYSKISISFFLVILLMSALFAAEKDLAKNLSKEKEKSRFEQLELFNKVLYLVESQYYRNVDTGKLIEGAIKGMLETLDPHSAYLDAEFFEKMKSETAGEFGGLGLEVTSSDGMIYVVVPIEDTPAFRAGMKPKDKIVEINNESILGMTLDEVVERMKGKDGSKVKIGVTREGEKGIKYFELKREIIRVSAVKSYLLEDDYLLIRLTQFQKRSAQNIQEAIEKYQKELMGKNKKIKGIILDLRANPGGLLDEAVDVSSLFLPDGVVVSTEGRDKTNKDIRYVKKSGFKDVTTPLVVLINGGSASASEIVAGALQDYKRAIIMGKRSFGKGSVQTVSQIDQKNGVKMTIAQYMTPLNRKIQAVGIKPDIEIEDLNDTWKDSIIDEELYLREQDLKNHLVAYEETAEEKKNREVIEKKERSERLKKIKEKNLANEDSKNKKINDEEIFKVYNPNDDFQVLTSLKHLKVLEIHTLNTKK